MHGIGVQIPGYEVGELLRRGEGTTVCRATREGDGLEVIAKVYPASEQGEDGRHEHEFALLSSLDIEGAVRAVELLRVGPRYVLILAYFPGVDLAEHCSGRALELGPFLDIATRVTSILAEVHQRRVVHRDIKPSSILITPSTMQICLADFGLSVGIERSHKEIYSAGMLTGTLPYLSPEQTGRTTRGVDLRSDLYSLGATFYELLSGRPPFTATDPLALVHAHLARVPLALDQVRAEIPEVLARIIARLLAKDPNQRYQSAGGLLVDLRRCQTRRQGRLIPGFEIGAEDFPERLELPARLYGREPERELLLDAFERACASGAELIMLRGPAGIGKTALIGELQGPLAGRGGHLVAGKFEQFRAHLPFHGLSQALSALVDQLLVQDPQRLEDWRARLGEALGPLASALGPLVPRLEALVAGVPGGPKRSAAEEHNRVLEAVTRVLGVVASPRHPVVLFLDDLQWADPGSVRALERLISEGGRGLLLIGAFRGDEIPEGHPLRAMVERSPAGSVVELGPLKPAAVTALIADTLRVEPEAAARLGRALAGRSDNNPLLIGQLLLLLEQQGALERTPRGWTWAEDAVLTVGIPEDALGMIQAKLARLPAAQRSMLAAASCVGSHFDVPSVAAALGSSPISIYPSLAALVDAGLLALAGEGLRFTHDRIEEAARAGLDPDAERSYHARVGRFRRDRTPEVELHERAHEFVDHLNWDLDSETDAARLAELARLNHVVGEGALRAAAYESAERYFEFGLQALQRGEVEDRHLELSLGLDRARCASFMGRRELAEARFDELLGSSTTPLEFARLTLARALAAAADGDAPEALRWGLRGLEALGVKLPRKPAMPRVLSLVARARWAYRASARARLRAAPVVADESDELRLTLLAGLLPSAFSTEPTLGMCLGLLAGLETARTGRSTVGALALGPVAVLMANLFGDRAAGEELMSIALEWGSKEGARGLEMATAMRAMSIRSWTHHYQFCAEQLELSHDLAVQVGNVEMAGRVRFNACLFHLFLGRPLAGLLDTTESFDRYAVLAGESALAAVTVFFAQTLRRALGSESADTHELAPPRRGEAAIQVVGALLVVHWAVVFNRHEGALEDNLQLARRAPKALFSFGFGQQFAFWWAMLAAMTPGRAAGRILSAERGRLAKWARDCPMNLTHLVTLLDAERARRRGRSQRAHLLYERAAEQAAKQGFSHIAALAHERLGRSCLAQGSPLMARAALQRARVGYLDWGARAKVGLLDEEFAALELQPPLATSDTLFTTKRSISSSSSSSRTRSSGTMNESLDLASVLKSTLAVTRGQTRAEVVDRVMASAIENAGAQRGVLIQDHGGAPLVEAEHDAEGSTARVTRPLPLAEAGELLPTGLVRYVMRVGEARIIADARDDADFASDPFIAELGAASIACIPIVRQDQLVGALYLENRLAAGVFTPGRLELLSHLAAQAAISLEAARLLDAVRHSEARWRSLVDHAPDDIAVVDREGNIELINRVVSGARPEQLLGRPVTELFVPEHHERVQAAFVGVFESGERAAFEAEVFDADGGRRWWTTRLGPISSSEGIVERVTMISTDVTEHRALEQQFRQIQKMEAIGTLAGGVAHDFNNLLSVILGSSELALQGLIPEAEALEEVVSAGERASTLTRQLLAFSRKQVLQPKIIDLNASVIEMRSLLARLLGEDIELSMELGPQLAPVRVDPGQLEQVILNLVVNARDAMPRGGKISLGTSQLRPHEARSGAYVTLSVSDTGQGMDEATRARIFEPFFTTKGVGKGTGLGLSTVDGIVNQSGGYITVDSELGEGTTFTVHLPAVAEEQREGESAAESSAELCTGHESILLVEDEAGVRKLTRKILELQGYTVGEASDFARGRALAMEGGFDLLLTDVVLTGGSGSELGELVRARHPGVEVLYMSGYTDDALVRHGIDAGTAAFIQKPFTHQLLARRVRELLDRRGE